jgi:hypothetical protein
MKYTVRPVPEHHGIFAVKDQNGIFIAEVFDEGIAEQIAALPEILAAMQDLMDEQNGPPLMRRERDWQTAYDNCDKILTRFNKMVL